MYFRGFFIQLNKENTLQHKKRTGLRVTFSFNEAYIWKRTLLNCNFTS